MTFSYDASKAVLYYLVFKFVDEFVCKCVFDIIVNVVVFGYIFIKMSVGFMKYGELSDDIVVFSVSFRRAGASADVAGVVVFFLSDVVVWIMGVVLFVDGGFFVKL